MRRFRRRGSLCVPFFIGINVSVYLAWTGLFEMAGIGPEFMEEHFLVSWDGLQEGRWWILLTSVFSHNLLIHILFNMIVLKSFGPFLERLLGSRSFATFYIFAGILSSLSHSLVSLLLLNEPHQPALGASGAIAGILLLFSLTFPKEKILLFFFIPMPAIVGALLFIGLDIWGLMSQVDGGGLPIGHGAHLGGAFAGILYFAFRKLTKNSKSNRQSY